MADFYVPSYSDYLLHSKKDRASSAGILKTEPGTNQSSDIEASVITSPITNSVANVKNNSDESIHSEHALAVHSRLSIATDKTDKTDDGNANLRGVDTPSARARAQSLFKYDREATRSIENVNIA
jgi:hypothetical protein